VVAFQDAFQTLCTAVLRGIGRPGIGTIGNLCYWIIGVPLGLVLDHVFHFDVYSYWWGLLIALIVICVFLVVYIAVKVDWKEEVQRAIDRMKTTEDIEVEEHLLNQDKDKSNDLSISKENVEVKSLDVDTDDLLSLSNDKEENKN